jgi:hypothetical protein
MSAKLIQFRVRYRGRDFARIKPTRETLRATVQTWLDTGNLPEGVLEIAPLVWGHESERETVREALAGRTLANLCPGVVDHYAEPNKTLCDYDTEQCPSLRRVWRVAQRLGIEPLAVEYAKSKRGWHVAVIWNREFSPAETVAMQLLLGSDVHRETFNLGRVLSGGAESTNRWNLLFSRKLP